MRAIVTVAEQIEALREQAKPCDAARQSWDDAIRQVKRGMLGAARRHLAAAAAIAGATRASDAALVLLAEDAPVPRSSYA